MRLSSLWFVFSLLASVCACASGAQDVDVDVDDAKRTDENGRSIGSAPGATEAPEDSTEHIGGGGGPDDTSGNATTTDTPGNQNSSTSKKVKRVFLTSTKYEGDLGGVYGADAKCATAAQAAALGGSWVAWISDSTEDAPDRVHGAGPWYAIDGTTKMFDDKASLATASLSDQWTDESGATVQAPFAWTATLNGIKTDLTCEDWTTSGGDGKRTLVSLGVTITMACDSPTSIFCVEQ
jgi:hypothetical protein